MVSPKNHRKISVFCELRRHRFCSIFRAKHNEWWLRLIWAIFRKTTNSLLRNKRKKFRWSNIWYVGDSVPFSLLAPMDNRLSSLLSVFPPPTPLCLSPRPRFTIDHTRQCDIIFSVLWYPNFRLISSQPDDLGFSGCIHRTRTSFWQQNDMLSPHFSFRNRWPWHAAWSVGLPCILLFVSVTELFFFRFLHVYLFRAKSPLTFSVAKLVQAVFCKYQCLIPWIFSKTFCRLPCNPVKTFRGPRVKNPVISCMSYSPCQLF